LNSISLSSLSHLKSLPSASDIKSKIIKTAIVFSDSEFSRKATTDNNQHDRKAGLDQMLRLYIWLNFQWISTTTTNGHFFHFPEFRFPNDWPFLFCCYWIRDTRVAVARATGPWNELSRSQPHTHTRKKREE
jgi:hypothetical protein